MQSYIEVTDQEKFDQTIKEISITHFEDLGDLKVDGELYITTTSDQVLPHYGILEADEFEKEFGFILRTSQADDS